MLIQVLGTGCPKCRELERNARGAAAAGGLEYTLEKVDSLADITAMGVLRTPALIVDGRVLIRGKVASAEEIAGLLER
jgi:small redox-active disulfide protein 2